MGIPRQSKAVHWADAIPSTPSPTFSSSSLPSSPALSTPPQPYRELPPHSPHSPTKGVPIQINPLLGIASSSPLIYDISQPPTTVLPRDRTVKSNLLEEPASYPSLPSITLRYSSLPWPIVITAGPRCSYITVADVLEGIYASLRIQATPPEFATIPSGTLRDSVVNAYQKRCYALADPKLVKAEQDKGIRRVDFLSGRLQFMGLKATAKGPNDWELSLS